MNENTNNTATAAEIDGAHVDKNTRVTKTGKTVGYFDPSKLPGVRKFRIYKLRSRTVKGEWTDVWQVQVKCEDLVYGGNWVPASRVASDHGMAYGDYCDKAKAISAGAKAKDTWGKEIEKKAPKAKEPTKKDLQAELKAAKAELAQLKAAKAE